MDLLREWAKKCDGFDLDDAIAKNYNSIRNGEKNMTREEATFKIQRKGFEGTRARELCDALEALGLIKFEEAPGPDCRDLIFSSSKPLVYQAIAQLESLGYTVKLNEKGK